MHFHFLASIFDAGLNWFSKQEAPYLTLKDGWLVEFIGQQIK